MVISKTGFKEISLFKSLILAWNSSSTQQLDWLHGLATSRHGIPRFVHIDSSTFLFQAITRTLLLHAEILVTLPCSLLDKLSNAYPHTSFSPRVWETHHFKMMFFTKCILVWNVNLIHLEFSSFSALKLLKIQREILHWTLAEIRWNFHWKNPKFSFVKIGPHPN